MAAVLCLEHSITSVVTHGKFIYVLCAGMARPLARFTAHSSYLKSIKESKPSIQVEGMTVEYMVEGEEEGGWKNSGGSTTTSEGNGTRRREEETEEGMIKEAVSSQSTPEEAERGAKEITEHAATPSPPSGRYDSEHTEGVAQPVASSGAHPTEHRVGSDTQGRVLTEPARSPPTAEQALKMTGSGESEEGGPKFKITAGGFPNEPSPDASTDRELGSGSRTSLEEAVETASPTVPDPNQLYSHPPMTSTSAQSSDHSSHRIPEPISDLERAHHPGRHQHGIGPEIGREVVDLLRPTLGKLSGLIRNHERDKVRYMYMHMYSLSCVCVNTADVHIGGSGCMITESLSQRPLVQSWVAAGFSRFSRIFLSRLIMYMWRPNGDIKYPGANYRVCFILIMVYPQILFSELLCLALWFTFHFHFPLFVLHSSPSFVSVFTLFSFPLPSPPSQGKGLSQQQPLPHTQRCGSASHSNGLRGEGEEAADGPDRSG